LLTTTAAVTDAQTQTLLMIYRSVQAQASVLYRRPGIAHYHLRLHGPAGLLAEEAAAGRRCCGALDLLTELVCSCGAGGYDKKNQSRDVEPADNRMLKADCHHRFDTFDTELNPSSPVLLVTENFQVVTGRLDLARALRFRR